MFLDGRRALSRLLQRRLHSIQPRLVHPLFAHRTLNCQHIPQFRLLLLFLQIRFFVVGRRMLVIQPAFCRSTHVVGIMKKVSCWLLSFLAPTTTENKNNSFFITRFFAHFLLVHTPSLLSLQEEVQRYILMHTLSSCRFLTWPRLISCINKPNHLLLLLIVEQQSPRRHFHPPPTTMGHSCSSTIATRHFSH